MRSGRPGRWDGVAGVVMSCATGSALAQPTWSSPRLEARSSPEAGVPGFNLPAESALGTSHVSLGQDGTVAIRVLMPEQDGVFVGRNAVGSLFVVGTVDLTPEVHINGSLMAFGLAAGGAEVRTLSGTPVRAFPPGGSENIGVVSGLRLLGDGTLAYRSTRLAEQKYVLDRFDGDTRVQTLVAQPNATYTFLFTPAANDARHILGVANLAPQGAAVVRFAPDATPTTIAQTGATYKAFASGVDVSGDGTAAFFARRLVDLEFELVRSNGVSPTRIAQPGQLGIEGITFGNFPPSINAAGLVAFRARDALGDAVFVGDGTFLVRLIGEGDTVTTDLGPITLGFDFPISGREALAGRVAINDANQVAFCGVLANGTIGVFVMDAAPTCVADMDDGTGTGTPDGGVDISDLLYFIALFDQGAEAADVDDGSGTGTRDGGVTIVDLLYYLFRFDLGC